MREESIMILDKRILNTSEAAYLLGISDRGVYQLIHSGKLCAYKDENNYAWHIPEEALKNYMATRLTETNMSIAPNR
jgi:excisionase family DNA binding protein